ncbi:uncharacterized protein TNCV_3530531 [Trichonephila clavipes]|nr:uncharacterized protein TNCV_3530531 [Trichonephila clavipes]
MFEALKKFGTFPFHLRKSRQVGFIGDNTQCTHKKCSSSLYEKDVNPGEDMDVCKCIVPSRHEDTQNSRRTASPLVRLVAGDERWEALTLPQGVLSQNRGETELNRTVTCMMLKAKAKDRRPSSPLP